MELSATEQAPPEDSRQQIITLSQLVAALAELKQQKQLQQQKQEQNSNTCSNQAAAAAAAASPPWRPSGCVSGPANLRHRRGGHRAASAAATAAPHTAYRSAHGREQQQHAAQPKSRSSSPRNAAAVSPQRQRRTAGHDSSSSSGLGHSTAYHAALTQAYGPPPAPSTCAGTSLVRKTHLYLGLSAVADKATHLQRLQHGGSNSSSSSPGVASSTHLRHAQQGSRPRQADATALSAAVAAATAAAAMLSCRSAAPPQQPPPAPAPAATAAGAEAQQEALWGYTSGYIDGRLAALARSGTRRGSGSGSSSHASGSPAQSLAGQLHAAGSSNTGPFASNGGTWAEGSLSPSSARAGNANDTTPQEELFQPQIRPQLVKDLAMRIVSAALAGAEGVSASSASSASNAPASMHRAIGGRAADVAAVKGAAQSLLASNPRQLRRLLQQMQRQQSTDLLLQLPSPQRQRSRQQQQQHLPHCSSDECLPEFSVSAFDREDHEYLIPVAHIGCQTSEVFADRAHQQAAADAQQQLHASGQASSDVQQTDGSAAMQLDACRTVEVQQQMAADAAGASLLLLCDALPRGAGGEEGQPQHQEEATAAQEEQEQPGAVAQLAHHQEQQSLTGDDSEPPPVEHAAELLQEQQAQCSQHSATAASTEAQGTDTMTDARPTTSPDKVAKSSSLGRIEELLEAMHDRAQRPTAQQQQEEPQDQVQNLQQLHGQPVVSAQPRSKAQDNSGCSVSPAGGPKQLHSSISRPLALQAESGSLLGLQVLERLLSDLHVLQQSTASRQHPHDAATVAAAGVDHLELSRLDALMAQVALLDHWMTERCGGAGHPVSAQLALLQQDLQAWRSRVVCSGSVQLPHAVASPPPATQHTLSSPHTSCSSTTSPARHATAISPTLTPRGGAQGPLSPRALSPRALSLQQQQWLASLPRSPPPARGSAPTSAHNASPEQQLLAPIQSGGLLRSRSMLSLPPVDEDRESEGEAAAVGSLVQQQPGQGAGAGSVEHAGSSSIASTAVTTDSSNNQSGGGGFSFRLKSGWLSPRNSGVKAHTPGVVAGPSGVDTMRSPSIAQELAGRVHSGAYSDSGSNCGGAGMLRSSGTVASGAAGATYRNSPSSSAEKKRGFMLALKHSLQHNVHHLGGKGGMTGTVQPPLAARARRGAQSSPER